MNLNMKCLAICPTFNRIRSCKAMVDSFKANTSPETDLVLGLSQNDSSVKDYIELAKEMRVGVYIMDTNCITDIINEIWSHASYDYNYFHITNDDVIYHPLEGTYWDEVLKYMLLHSGKQIAYGNDLLQMGNLCTFPLITKELARETGWLQMPTLYKLWGDTVWMYLGKMAEIIAYNHEVIIEHKSWINNKRINDDKDYMKYYKADEEAYNKWVETKAPKLIKRLKEKFNVKPKAS